MESSTSRNQRTREAATRRLQHAKRKVRDAQSDIVRATGRLQRWQNKVRYYEKQAALTDAEMDAARDKRILQAEARAAKKGRRRAVSIGRIEV